MPKKRRSDLTGKRNATRSKAKRALMTEEQLSLQRAKTRKYAAHVRANETEDQRAERLLKANAYSRKIRKNKKYAAERAARLARKTQAERDEAERAARLARKAQAERDEAGRAARRSRVAEAKRNKAKRANKLSLEKKRAVKLSQETERAVKLSQETETATRLSSQETESAARLSQETETAARLSSQEREVAARLSQEAKTEQERDMMNSASQKFSDLLRHPNRASENNSNSVKVNQNLNPNNQLVSQKTKCRKPLKSKSLTSLVKRNFLPFRAEKFAIPWVDYTSSIIKYDDDVDVEPTEDPLALKTKTENN